MPPNKQGRKQRTRGKNISNVPRERTVLTLAEDPISAPPYMLPSQSPFTPTLGNMFTPFHHQQGQKQQSGVSIPDMTGFTYQQQQQPNTVPPFGGQGSPFFNHMQQTFQGSGQSMVQQQQHPPSQQQQSGSGEVSDIEKLRKLKQTILSGQHPFFQPVPYPDALGSLYLGPHPLSQAFKEHEQQQFVQLGSLSQSQPDKSKITTGGAQKPDGASQVISASVLNAAKRPQTPSTTSGHVSRISGSLATPQSMSPSTFNPTGTHQTQNTANGSLGSSRVDHSSGRPHHNVTIPPKSHDFRTSTPSPLPPNSAKSSAPLPPQQHHGPLPVHSSGASGADHDQSRVPPPTSATASAASLNESAGINKPPPTTTDAKGTTSYKDTHPDALSPGGLDRDREREHDRERSGYLPYDSPRYSHPSDRRDAGRYSQRYPDSRYDRDREWARGRDWEGDRERDRERERERDRERDRARDRLEYERSGRPSMDRRPPPPPSAASVDQKPLVPVDQQLVPRLGPPPEQRRSEVPPHPEQHPRPEVPTPPEQRRAEVPVHSDQRRSEVPERPEQRTLEAAPHTGEHPHGSEPAILRPAPASTSVTAPYSNHFPGRDRSRASQGPPVPRAGPPGAAPPPLRTDQHPPPVPLSADDQSGLHSVPSDQRTSSGNSVSRSGPPSPETNRRPDTANTSMHPSTGTPTDHGTSHSAQDRRLTHPSESQLPRTPVMSESRAGHGQGQDEREVSRPFFPNATPSAAPRAISRAPSPGPRRPTDSYDASRERDRTPSMSSPSYRELPPAPTSAPSRGYPEDSRRQPVDANVPRRVSDNFYPPPASPVPAIVERREEVRQWREREGYPPASYSSSDAERERARRYPETREWPGDAYSRERDPRVTDIDVHSRPRPPPPPPSSWDRDRSIDTRDKDKERDGYENWANAERKYPGPAHAPPSSRWEDPAIHTHRPLHARLTDTYDDRFIPREIAERARYPPPAPNDVMNYRDNPRVRQRSPSPARRPGVYDDTHRAPKRPREEYEASSRVPYEYPPRAPSPPPPPPPYYDPRAPALANPRDPSPYGRDRVPDPMHRRDMPPPRSPPYYARDRYPPR